MLCKWQCDYSFSPCTFNKDGDVALRNCEDPKEFPVHTQRLSAMQAEALGAEAQDADCGGSKNPFYVEQLSAVTSQHGSSLVHPFF